MAATSNLLPEGILKYLVDQDIAGFRREGEACVRQLPTPGNVGWVPADLPTDLPLFPLLAG
ncbi:MAG: hypothetical protein ACTS8S_18215 [Giesbergeria sp.]